MLESNNQEKILRLKQLLKDVSLPNNHAQTNVHHQDSFNKSKTQIKKSPAYNILHPVEQQVLELEEKLQTRLEQDWRIFQNLSYEVQQVMDASKGLRKDLQKSKEMNQRKASKVESQVSEQVTQQIDQIRVLKKQLNESIQHKYKTIKVETMTVLGNQFQIGTDIARQEILNQIVEIKSSMDRQENLRDQLVTEMVNRIGDQILKLEHSVQKEKEERIDHSKRIMTNICNLQQQMENMILLQRREAINSHNSLEACLQELCYKIQNQILR